MVRRMVRAFQAKVTGEVGRLLSRTVVMVAVETRERVAIASGVRDIEKVAPVG